MLSPARFVIRLLLAVLFLPSVALAADGKQVFTDRKCVDCHSIQAQGIEKKVSKNGKKKKGPDLSGVGTKYDAAQIASFLQKKSEHKSVYGDKQVKHKKKFKGSDEDLKVLADYLAQQKSKVTVSDDGAEDDSDDDKE